MAFSKPSAWLWIAIPYQAFENKVPLLFRRLHFG